MSSNKFVPQILWIKLVKNTLNPFFNYYVAPYLNIFFIISFCCRVSMDWFRISVEYVTQSLPDIYVDKLLGFVASQFESTRHIQFYLQVNCVKKFPWKHAALKCMYFQLHSLESTTSFYKRWKYFCTFHSGVKSCCSFMVQDWNKDRRMLWQHSEIYRKILPGNTKTLVKCKSRVKLSI